MARTSIIELEPEEIAAATAWHGGQSSMLYAVASTGGLSRGTVRPRERLDADPSDPYARHYRDLTDLEWDRYLVEKLESEASEDAESARERAAAPELDLDDDPDELLEHADALDSIAAKCRAWLDRYPADLASIGDSGTIRDDNGNRVGSWHVDGGE